MQVITDQAECEPPAFAAAAERLSVSANAAPGRIVMYGSSKPEPATREVVVSTGTRRFIVQVPNVLGCELRTIFAADPIGRRKTLSALFQYCYEATMPYEAFISTPYAQREDYASFRARLDAEASTGLATALKTGLGAKYSELMAAMHADLRVAWEIVGPCLAMPPAVESEAPSCGRIPFMFNIVGADGQEVDCVFASEENVAEALASLGAKAQQYVEARQQEITNRFAL